MVGIGMSFSFMVVLIFMIIGAIGILGLIPPPVSGNSPNDNGYVIMAIGAGLGGIVAAILIGIVKLIIAMFKAAVLSVIKEEQQ